MSSTEDSSSDLAGCHDDPLPNKFFIRDYVFTSRNKDIGINWPFPQHVLQVCLDNGIRDVLPPFEHSSPVRACCFKQEARFEQLTEFFGNKQVVKSVYDDDARLVVSCDQSHRDPMDSKVCPVCKSFSATSNTTLNAHIDGCLSPVQPNAAADVTECSKVRPKLRKKRLMVDIYTTAPHCTLEELDKRNGTNWATNLSLVAPAISDTVNRGDVGDIYVDSNGMKLLILSKFNDSHPFITRRRLKLKMSGNEFKASKTSCLVAKKKSFTPKCSSFMEDNQKKKKLNVNMGFRGEIKDACEGNNMAEAYQEKKETMSQMLSAQEQIESSEPTNLKHWVCSKRSDLLRKLDGKEISKGSEKMVGTARKLLIRLTQPDSSNRPNKRTTGSPNFSRSSVAAASSPRTKRVNILSNTKKAMDSAKTRYCQLSNLNSNSSPGDSLVGGHMANISSKIQSSRPSLKVRKNLISKKSILSRRTSVSLEASDGVDIEELVTPKKFQKKHRSMFGCSKRRRGDKLSNVDGGCHGSSEDFGLISFKANTMNRSDTMRSTETSAPVTDNYLDQSHEERQIDSPSQISTHDQEMQDCGNAISNDIIGHNNQLEGEDEPMSEEVRYAEDPQTDTRAVQDPHPCFTNHEETGFDYDQKNSSETSFGVIYNQDHKMVANVESDSPASTYTSAICSPSTEDDRVKLFPPEREPSCSCSQRLIHESQVPNSASKKKMASDLFIKTSTLSAYEPCQSMESPTESVVTMASPKSSENISNARASARNQAAPYPILRLMGKDLVVHTERDNVRHCYPGFGL